MDSGSMDKESIEVSKTSRRTADAATERLFPANIAALDDTFAFASDFCRSHGLAEATNDVQLIVEELFTNMVKYERDGWPEIGIRLRSHDNRIVIEVWHDEVEPFDPTRPDEDDDNPDRYVTELRPGGRGIRLVRHLTEAFAYEYNDRRSTVTATLYVRSQRT